MVLTVGNLPSRQRSDGVVVHDPWADDATAGLRPNEPVMVVGTGLTMVDLVLGMRSRGFAGPIIALSRRGLVPQRHAPAGGTWPTPALPSPNAARSLPCCAGCGLRWRRLQGRMSIGGQ